MSDQACRAAKARPHRQNTPGPAPRATKKIPLARAQLRRRWKSRLLQRRVQFRILKTCAAFALLALLILMYNALDLGHALDLGQPMAQNWLDTHIRAQGAWGYPLFVLLATTVTSFAGPRQLVSFAGGYVYGPLLGAALSLLGSLLGCTINFFSARLLARNVVRRCLGAHCERIDSIVKRSPFLMIIAIRLLPLGNNTTTSLAAGLTTIPLPPFLTGSAIGYLPMTVVFALLGNGLQMDNSLNIALGGVLFAISLGLGLYLFKRLRVQV